jgi:uncharacterized OsmC-like protein
MLSGNTIVDAAKLRRAYDSVVQDLARDSSFQIGVIRVHTTLLKNTKSEARVGGFGGKGYDKSHTFYCDEREPLGGGNEAPAPLEYFVAGLNLSLQNTFVFWAVREKNVGIKRLEIQSYAHFNRLGVYDGGEPDIVKLVCEVSIDSDSDPLKVREAIETAAMHSVAYRAFNKVAPLELHITVNGQKLK